MQERRDNDVRDLALALLAVATSAAAPVRVELWDVALCLAAIAAGAAWARLAAIRAGERRLAFSLRALLGGAAAYGVALIAFELARRFGFVVRWEALVRGDATAFLVAAAIGLVEEGAKLVGVLLVVGRGVRTPAAVAVGFGVGAGFAAIEAIFNLAGDASARTFTRAALGPLAHGLLLVPAALAVAPALRCPRPVRALALPLAASAALHGAGDLALALPGVGTLGFAVALVAPALVLFALAQRRRASAPQIVAGSQGT